MAGMRVPLNELLEWDAHLLNSAGPVHVTADAVQLATMQHVLPHTCKAEYMAPAQ
jgi:hypothetical protein